jgi:hypothetical protein
MFANTAALVAHARIESPPQAIGAACDRVCRGFGCNGANLMKPQLLKSRSARTNAQGASVGAFLFFAGAVVFTIGLLAVTSKFTPLALQAVAPPRTENVPVAMIQLPPDSSGRCRTLLFHNDKQSVEEGGIGRCHGLIPEEMLVWTIQNKAAMRNEAVSRAFKFR